MPTPIEFYFDFSSPYGYLASRRIDALAAKYGRQVAWRPILLGLVFKHTGAVPLVNIPLKGDYSRRDVLRSAAFHDIPFNFPKTFPFSSKVAGRAFYGLEASDAEQARTLAQAVFHAYFVDGKDVVQPMQVAEAAEVFGLEKERVLAAIEDPAADTRLRSVTDEAIGKGVCGSPFILIDGEPFWGNDRFDQMERWLETGGW
jgi:2-hydroxychromene-2-carboxylate isomerase